MLSTTVTGRPMTAIPRATYRLQLHKGFRFADADWNRTYTAVDDNEFVTTDTEESAIAAPAIIGFSKKPLNGHNTPAASGIPMML